MGWLVAVEWSVAYISGISTISSFVEAWAESISKVGMSVAYWSNQCRHSLSVERTKKEAKERAGVKQGIVLVMNYPNWFL